MFRAAHRSSSGALNWICSLWFKCPYGDLPLPRLSGHCSAHSLMMSGVPLETCWAFKKLWNNKFYYKAASCWYFYWVKIVMPKIYSWYRNDEKYINIFSNLKKYLLSDIGVHRRTILKWIFCKQNKCMWPGYMWLRMGTCGVLFLITFGFYTRAKYLGQLRGMGHAVAQWVEALRYKPEGRGFNYQWCHWNFSLT